MLEQLYTIVNTRYEDGRAIVITTNLSPPELRSRSASGRCRGSPRCAATRSCWRAPTSAFEPDVRVRRAAPLRRAARAPPRLLDFTHGMAGTVIVGAQWGDEGKGKVIDLLAETRTS